MEGEAAGEWQQVAGRVDRSGWRVPHHVAIHRTFESSWEMVTKELIRLSKMTKNQMYPAVNVPLSIFINTKENKSCSCSINASLLIVVIKITLVTWRKRIFNQMSNVKNTFDICFKHLRQKTLWITQALLTLHRWKRPHIFFMISLLPQCQKTENICNSLLKPKAKSPHSFYHHSSI